MNRIALAAAAAALALPAVAFAGFTETDPGLFTDIDDRFEARIRLDGGNSQTWKTAFWEDTNLLNTSGVDQNVFGNGVTYGFSLTYDSISGLANLDIAGLNVSETISLDPGYDLAGLEFFVRSESDGATRVDNLGLSLDGAPAQAVDPLESSLGEVFVQGPTLYFDEVHTTLEFTGDLTFSWDPGANLQGERFKFSTKILQGQVIPAPASFAMMGMMLFGGRRRRA